MSFSFLYGTVSAKNNNDHHLFITVRASPREMATLSQLTSLAGVSRWLGWNSKDARASRFRRLIVSRGKSARQPAARAPAARTQIRCASAEGDGEGEVVDAGADGDADIEAVRTALALLDKRIQMAVTEEEYAAAARLRDEKTETLGSLPVGCQILITRLDRLCGPGVSDEDRAVAANALMEARDTRALPSLAAALRVSPGHVRDGNKQHSLVEMTMWLGLGGGRCFWCFCPNRFFVHCVSTHEPSCFFFPHYHSNNHVLCYEGISPQLSLKPSQ